MGFEKVFVVLLLHDVKRRVENNTVRKRNFFIISIFVFFIDRLFAKIKIFIRTKFLKGLHLILLSPKFTVFRYVSGIFWGVMHFIYIAIIPKLEILF